QHKLFCASENRQSDANARLVVRQQAMKYVNSGDLMIVQANDDIPVSESCLLGRTVLFNTYDKNAGINGQMMGSDQCTMQRHVLARHTKITAPNPAVFDESTRNELRSVDRNREADALRRQNDCSVHTNDLAIRGDQRTAGISGIQRGIGLNNVVDET